MPEVKRVEEIMIPLNKYPHIPYWFTLRQAIAEMEKSELDINGRKSLPRVVLVFDEKYRLMGTVRRRDIMRGLEPEFLSSPSKQQSKWFNIQVDPNLMELSFDKVVIGIRERAERPVSEVMLPIARTIDAGDHLMKVIYEMVSNDLSLIPVTREGRVIGVIRSVDVFHEIATLIL